VEAAKAKTAMANTSTSSATGTGGRQAANKGTPNIGTATRTTDMPLEGNSSTGSAHKNTQALMLGSQEAEPEDGSTVKKAAANEPTVAGQQFNRRPVEASAVGTPGKTSPQQTNGKNSSTQTDGRKTTSKVEPAEKALERSTPEKADGQQGAQPCEETQLMDTSGIQGDTTGLLVNRTSNN